MFKISDLDFDFSTVETTPEIEKSFEAFNDALPQPNKSIIRSEKAFEFTEGYKNWPYLKKVAYHENEIQKYVECEKELTGKFLSLNNHSKRVHVEALKKLHANYKK